MPPTREQRIANLRDGRARVAAAGGRLGGQPPYGWTGTGQEFIPHPDEQPVVWLVCHLARRGWSLQTIADELERLNIPPRTGRRWGKGVLHGILLRELPAAERRTAARRAPAASGEQLAIRAAR